MRTSFLVFFGLFGALPLQASDRQAQFNDKGRVVAGTDGRLEMEFKLAYLVDSDTSTRKIGEQIKSRLEKMIADKEFGFDRLVNQRYAIDRTFQAFVFKDIYLDTTNRDLLRQGAAYRLRYRWNFEESYYRHIMFPWITSYYPTRCEIQFKSGYLSATGDDVVSPTETRFEFRPESEPFLTDGNAPPAPWPDEEYLTFAKDGVFRNYRLKPMVALLEVLETKELPDLEEMFTLTTVRDRIHFNVRHPWGSGPNPEQIFIITIDKSSLHLADQTQRSSSGFPSLLEIEVEIERNGSTELRKMIDADPNYQGDFAAVHADAISYANKAWNMLVSDLNGIRMAVRKTMTPLMKKQPLPVDYKYSRFSRLLEKFKRGESVTNDTFRVMYDSKASQPDQSL